MVAERDTRRTLSANASHRSWMNSIFRSPHEENLKYEDGFKTTIRRIWRFNRWHCRVARGSPTYCGAYYQCTDDGHLLGDRAAHRGIRAGRRETGRVWRGTNGASG